ncbi:carbamoyl-phosphate synthase (glutamine-hydrolyzing) large subunit [Candidatus Gottesmanbacteria bacterium]|nr:carbamoyl-phosphate synthase (glutamine-hydrolyzing) large subunit [Candidatus Gottesmanbacteria bacterium]
MKKILLLGSGALKIGEAGEFDYSGTQAIKALKEEGRDVILVNPNIATIQTSEGLADRVYFLPVTPDFVERVITKERPDAILLSFGGQTALNCGIGLYTKGVLKRNNVEILGTPMATIIDTEDRELFAKRLQRIGLATAKGVTVKSVKEGVAYAETFGYPIMLRTGFALGGTGSGIARSRRELEAILSNAFAATSQVILEECLYGWKEVEYEVMRDCRDNCITVCNMENFDPVGIHTGESVVVAPSQTLNDDEYYQLRQISIDTIRELGIVGECNIQFALHPKTGQYRIIEVNARLSRSSALASKATGYPLAYIAAKLALGKTLPELRNSVTGSTSAFFEPALDYVVVKIPRWDLEKYEGVDPTIGSEMKSVGEVMAIARTFKEAVQKAVRMLGQGYEGVIDEDALRQSRIMLRKRLATPDAKRMFVIGAALARGITVDEIAKLTGIDPWYLSSLERIVFTYQKLKKSKILPRELLAEAKRQGFSDIQIAHLRSTTEDSIRSLRKKLGVKPCVKRIDTMAGEFPAKTNYLYMTYAAGQSDHLPTSKEKKVIVLGSGPYAIGTSVEFDWCAVNTVTTVRDQGKKTVMVNCNPETVSTDYDYSDYLYFEELSLERVLDIYDLEKSPFILSVGGQIPNNLAPKLAACGIPILGSDAKIIEQAENRHIFSKLLDTLGVAQPAWGESHSIRQSVRMARSIGFPILLRPSFVLSGKAMLVIEKEELLVSYLKSLDLDIGKHPLVMTRFLQGAMECDMDGVAKEGRILIWAISEHVEHGGVHSGDATMVLPPHSLPDSVRENIVKNAGAIVATLGVNGPFNIQFLVSDGKPYVIECNLRASRSFPFVSKTLRQNFIRIATQVALGNGVTVPVKKTKPSYVCVKVPQFSFKRLRGADPVLRVEMSSTGEVAAFGVDVHEAYLKALLATGLRFPDKKTVFLSLGGGGGKLSFLAGAACLRRLGFTLFATRGTYEFLNEHNIPSRLVGKLHEGIHPNFVDLLKDKTVGFSVVLPERFTDNTRTEVTKGISDGYIMRRMSIDMGIPIFTNAQSAYLFVESMERYQISDLEIKHWSEYKGE